MKIFTWKSLLSLAIAIAWLFFARRMMQPLLFYILTDIEVQRLAAGSKFKLSTTDAVIEPVASWLLEDKWAEEVVQLSRCRNYAHIGVLCSVMRELNPLCIGNFNGEHANRYWDCYREALWSNDFGLHPWDTCLREKVIAYEQLMAAMTDEHFQTSVNVAQNALCCTQLPTEEQILEKWACFQPNNSM